MKKSLFNILSDSGIEYEIVSSDGKTKISKENSSNPEITSLVFDSRQVKPDSLFFALPGTHTTGNVFIPKAIENGASAVVFEGDLEVSNSQGKAFPSLQPASLSSATPSAGSNPATPPVFIRVENARKVMAPISASFYDNPSSNLPLSESLERKENPRQFLLYGSFYGLAVTRQALFLPCNILLETKRLQILSTRPRQRQR